ncbi:hypothetical protein Leryth_020874 [Lithospermum erythrorhizon]|nr:hypothetical protein Leryth_020874 [Lithospermum erythrorhizon]
MVGVDWSDLPGELVELISSHLPTETDVIRFRSVCSTWRSSTNKSGGSGTLSSFPSRFPILPNQGISDTCWGFHLSKRTLYQLQPPFPLLLDSTNHNNDWIIKLERDNPTRMHLLSPLSTSLFNPLPPQFPRSFDSSKFPIFELGNEFTLQYINYRPLANSIGDAGNLYMEKVALSLLDAVADADTSSFVLLTIHISGKLVMYKSGDKKWTVIDDLPAPYDDVIFKGGCFYAVDTTGRAVLVEFNPASSTPIVTPVAESVHGGDKKYLVESCGDLLLVDMYLSGGPEDDFGYIEGFQFYEDFDCYMSERTVKFKVFKLDKDMHHWEEMDSLGDMIIFLGDNSTFSALASEINSSCKGNCIFFTDQFYSCKEEEEGGVWKSRGIGVFDMETGKIGPIGDNPGYSAMFWPPPDWVYSTATIEEAMEQLNI